MGQQAAKSGTQAATQAARTSGVNKGQSALLGAQQAGNAYTQGQQAGQGMGMNAYAQGANTQLGGVNAQTGAGQAQGNLGTNQINSGQEAAKQGNAATGSLISAVGGAFGLKDGGVVTQPTKAVVGEAGPEAVIPLDRISEILAKLKGAPEPTTEEKPSIPEPAADPKVESENPYLATILALSDKVRRLEAGAR
jgi:hypothetical protein